MKRKVIQMAGKTMVISLPSDWVKKLGIKKGEELELEEKGREILISTKKDYSLNKIRIDITNLDKQVIKWALSAIHKSGYDEIEVLYTPKEQIEVIEEMIKNVMMGYEITEQTQNKCIIKMISKGVESEFDNTLRRIFLVTLAMADEGFLIVKTGDYSKLNEMLQKEITNNKLTNFCEMILNKAGFKDHKKTTFIYLIVWLLESIADDYRDMYKHLINNKRLKLDKDILNIYDQTNGILRSYYNTFYDYNSSKLVEINNNCKETIQKIHLMFKVKKHEEIVLLTYLLGVIQKVRDFSASTIAINL